MKNHLFIMSHRDCNNNKQNFNHKRTVNKNKNHWVFIVPLSMRHPVINNDLTENIERSWRIYRLALHCRITNDNQNNKNIKSLSGSLGQ